MTIPHILAIDQGTTSARTMIFDARGKRVAGAQAEFTQHYPAPGWVEHDPEDIWRETLATARKAIADSGIPVGSIAGIGISNQRETVVIWDRATGKPIHRAIVWQDRRTASVTDAMRARGLEDRVREATGLLLDPYFSATKIGWILDHAEGARESAERGELAFGTIDCFLLWRLTGGRVHATDASNASRTLLYNLETGDWDEELCDLFGVPLGMLPRIGDNVEVYGMTDPDLFGAAIPVAGMAGDQQAALVGQACFRSGMVKSTYGTGCFVVMNTGGTPVRSRNRLLTTVGYRIGGETTYALEGSIFVAGAAIAWLRDGMGLFAHARDTQDMAAALPDNGGVYMVPAFAGLGAPHWDAHARGAILGLTLGSTAAHVVRAALESVAYQTMDLIDAMVADGAARPETLRVDGGMVANDWFCTFLAGMLGVPVDRPADVETTARGAACLAGLATGVWRDLAEIEGLSTFERTFRPALGGEERDRLANEWHAALARVLSRA